MNKLILVTVYHVYRIFEKLFYAYFHLLARFICIYKSVSFIEM